MKGECKVCGYPMPYEDKDLCVHCEVRYSPAARLPIGLINKSFDTFIESSAKREAIMKAKDFIDSGKSLYLFGDPGSGKTHLAAASFTEALKQFKKCEFFNVADMLHLDRDEYETREESEIRFVNSFKGYQFVYLDDLCAENATGRTVEVLYLILNNSLLNLKPKFFITSNKPVQDLNIVSQRIASRIVELCGKDNIRKMTGDYRLNF